MKYRCKRQGDTLSLEVEADSPQQAACRYHNDSLGFWDFCCAQNDSGYVVVEDFDTYFVKVEITKGRVTTSTGGVEVSEEWDHIEGAPNIAHVDGKVFNFERHDAEAGALQQ